MLLYDALILKRSPVPTVEKHTASGVPLPGHCTKEARGGLRKKVPLSFAFPKDQGGYLKVGKRKNKEQLKTIPDPMQTEAILFFKKFVAVRLPPSLRTDAFSVKAAEDQTQQH